MKVNLRALLSGLCLLCLCSGRAYSQELLKNPGFEKGVSDWQLSKTYPGRYEIKEGNALEGNCYLEIENDNYPAKGKVKPTYFHTEKTFSVKKEDLVRMECWARGKGSIQLSLFTFGLKAGKFSYLGPMFSKERELTDKWQKLEWDYIVQTENLTRLRYAILLRSPGYVADIDRCSFKIIGGGAGGEGMQPLECVEAISSGHLETVRDKDAYAPSKAIDSDPNRGWVAKDWESWLVVKLAAITTINHTYWERTGKKKVERSLKDYDLEVSLDGKKFTKVKEVRDFAGLSKDDYFKPAKALYVKLNIISPRQIPASIGEFKVFAGTEHIVETRARKVAEKDMGILKFRSRKILYDFNEKGEAQIVVRNSKEKSQELLLKVTEQWGIRKPRILLDKSVNLEAGKKAQMVVDLPVKKEECGHHLLLEVRDSKGKLLNQAEDVYEVAHEWAKLVRQSNVLNIFGPKVPEELYDYEIEQFRKAYINEVEISHINEFNSVHPDGSKPTWISEATGSEVILEKLKTFIEKLHANGIKARSYNHMPGAEPSLIPDKSMILYGPYDPADDKWLSWYGGRPWYKKTPIRDRSFKTAVVVDARKFAPAFARNLVDSTKAVGWDSIYMDGYKWAFTIPAIACNSKGEIASDETPDEMGAEVLKLYYDRLRKAKDNYYIFPSINFCGMIPTSFPSDRHKIMEWEMCYPKIAQVADVWAVEIHLHYKKKAHSRSGARWPQTYETLGPAMHGLREKARVSVLSIASWSHAGFFTVNQVKPMFAVMLSSGLNMWDAHHGEKSEIINKEATEAIRQYYRFAARYGEYIYGTDIRWPKDDMVKVDAPERVYWRNTYFEKKTGEGKDIYIHLINLPDEHRLWFRERNVPQPVKDIRVEVDVPAGFKVENVYYANADGEQNPEELEFKSKKGKLTFVVPYLEYWDLVIIKTKRG